MEALKDINESIRLNENYVKALARRAQIYMDMKMYEEACYDYQQVKEKEPSFPGIKNLIDVAKKEEKKSKKRDYYAILGVEKDANEIQIKKAYKKLAIKYHPDKNSSSEEAQKLAEKTFRDVSDAYTVLSDPKKRNQFDNGMDPNNPEEAGKNFIF
jgi:DnaJ family protein C protein 7